MTTEQALVIILDMAHGCHSRPYMADGKHLRTLRLLRAEGPSVRLDKERQAIEEVESLLESYEDNDYKDEDYMED